MSFTLQSFDNPDMPKVEDSNPLFVAADIHNIANNESSFWDDPVGSVSAIPKFLGLGIASGLNQLYNIAPTIGNWFGGDYEMNKLSDTLADFDSDIAKYYEEHQQGVDVLGFALSSLVPGTAGIKVLKAGQTALNTALETGNFGTNFSKATGLLVPKVNKNVINATEQMISGGTPFTMHNAHVIKALGAGAGQSFLEGAAFEIATAATMYNSPVLEGQDLKDLAANVLWGAGLFGVIGGAITGVKSVGAIKKGLSAFDEAASPWTFIAKGREGSSAADNILLYNEQRLSMPSVIPGAKFGLKAGEEGFEINVEKQFVELGKKKQDNLLGMIQEEFTKLTKGDTAVAEMLYKDFLSKDAKKATETLWELEQVLRPRVKSTGEKLLTKVLKSRPALSEAAEALEYNTNHLVLRGSQAGKVIDDVPIVDYLGDTLRVGTRISINAKGVQVGKEFTRIDPSKEFDILKAKHYDVEKRLAWARKNFTPEQDTIINASDIALLDVAYAKASETGIIPFIRTGGVTYQPASIEAFLKDVISFKEQTATELMKRRKLPQDVVAKMVNVKSDSLTNLRKGSDTENLFADLSDLAAHNKRYGQQREHLLDVPSVLKLSYKKSRVTGEDGNWLKGMEAVQRQQRLYQDSANRTGAAVLGEDINKLIPINMEEITKATRLGAGASFITFASGNYGSLGSKFEYLGKVVNDIISSRRAATREVLEPLLYKLQNSQEATIEWSKLMQTVRGSEYTWKLAEDGKSLVIADAEAAKQALASGKDIPAITFKNEIVEQLAKAHVEVNGARVANMNALRASQGLKNNLRPDTFYAPPPNPKDYPYFAFVTDPTVTGTGHSKMLFASTEAELKTQMAAVKAQFPEFRVYEKGEAERYYKRIGQFEYEKTIHDNYVDSALKRKGILTPFLIKTDPKAVVDELFQWHLNAESGIVRETVSHIYEPQFNALRELGEQYTLAATSKYGTSSLAKYAEASVENPYTDYIKTALGINKAHEYPFWMPVQKMFDNKVSQMWKAVKSASSDIKSTEDLRKINNILEESGFKGAYYDAALNSAVNSKLPRGVLTNYVQESNAVLSLFALRLDPLNALNNVIGSNVLLNTEIRSLIRNIEGANKEAAGELAGLLKLKVPGTDKEILNHGKLLANAIKNFHSSDKALHEFYKANKFTTDIRTQYMQSLDDMALKGTESIGTLENKRQQLVALGKKWAGRGEKLSGNAVAEEFNRFVAADVMRQITDVAVKNNLMDSRTALSYINTFVNRTQGNFMAAQRPMMFQGPVGQAIGLFQTYQFNLLQQLFRHVAEGSGKDAAILLGLQGSIYGMNGLPAFNAINTHIVGNAAGNKEHRDLYSAVYSGAGKDAGDWLMYGLASNMFLDPDLKVNMYTRGDINPRHVTVIPTNPADVPFINAQVKFFGNMFETLGKIGDGGNTASIFLQGLEHNGISRPLAGLAQTMQAATNPEHMVYSTSKKGNIVGANDLYSLMTLGRLVGGKPLDEALMQDANFRLTAYASEDAAKVAKLGEVVKSTLIGGGTPDENQLQSFMEQYVSAGGNQAKFNQFMLRQMKSANKSQAEQIRDAMKKPYSQTLQQIMGGYDPTPQPQMDTGE